MLEIIINQPEKIAEDYKRLWESQLGKEREFYDFVRDEFNKTCRPDYLLYLLARCVKASVRYNANGEFNQSPDNRRRGRLPRSMQQEILGVSRLLKGKAIIKSGDYKEVLDIVSESDVVYLDPPYQGTSQNRDPRYYSGVRLDELVDFLTELNRRQVSFILSYDGRTGTKTYGAKLPAGLNLQHLEIHAGRSSQSTLLGGVAETYESLYLSPALAQKLRAIHVNEVSDLISVAKLDRSSHARQLKLDIL